jgi:hypothetical protein
MNSISIDSLKLRIPLTHVELLDKGLLDHYVEINESTGEIESEEYKLKFKEHLFSNTSKVKLGIEKRMTMKGHVQECLMIYINSKILRSRYFEGITIDNIESVYNDLMSLKVFSVSYEIFLRSDCTDVDFKLDEKMTQPEWNELLNQFKLVTIPSKDAEKGYKEYKPRKSDIYNNGLQYNTRDKASPSRPFLKLYWKGGEMESKSKEFRDEHLPEISNEELLQIVRIETTIKNKLHGTKLGLENMTLLYLLSLTEKTKESLFRQMLGKYLERPKRQTTLDHVKDSRMSPTELVFYSAIVSLMDHTKDTPENVIDCLIQGIDHKVAKSRKKSELNEIYEQFIKGTKVDLRNEKINSFFSKFEWL